MNINNNKKKIFLFHMVYQEIEFHLSDDAGFIFNEALLRKLP